MLCPSGLHEASVKVLGNMQPSRVLKKKFTTGEGKTGPRRIRIGVNTLPGSQQMLTLQLQGHQSWPCTEPHMPEIADILFLLNLFFFEIVAVY